MSALTEIEGLLTQYRTNVYGEGYSFAAGQPEKAKERQTRAIEIKRKIMELVKELEEQLEREAR